MADRELAADVASDLAQTHGLDELRTAIDQLNGTVSSARRGVADEVLLRVRDRVADGTTVEWKIGTQASDWVIASPSFVLAGAHADNANVDQALSALEGARLLRAEITDRLALVLIFRDQRWLEVQGIVSDEADTSSDDPPYWEVFTPDSELVSAGPGPLWLRSDATQPPPQKSSSDRDVEHLSDASLLEMWREATAELRRRGIVRHPQQPALGEIAEELVRKHYDGFRGSYRDAGWDVLTNAGERLQVKAVQRRGDKPGPPRVLVPPTGLYDSLVIVFFDEGLRVDEAWHVPSEVVESFLHKGQDRDGRRLANAAALLKDPASKQISLES